MVSHLPIIIVVMPLMAAFFVFAAGGRYTKSVFPAAMLSLTVCVIASVILLSNVLANGPLHYYMGGWKPPWGIALLVDVFNGLMLVLVSSLSAICTVFARRSVQKLFPEKTVQFWSLYLLLITGLFGILVTGDLFNLFVLLEVASLSGYALVAMGRKSAAVAAFRYLVLGTIGASFYLLGVGYLYIATGSLNMADVAGILPTLYTQKTVLTGFIFICVGFSLKIALFPLHAWQPDAYTQAPTAVTVIISTAAAKTFVYALVRIVFSVFTVNFIMGALPLFDILSWIAAAAMIAGSINAIKQYNLKRMLAYSSVANVGYLVLGIGLAPVTVMGLTPVVVHMVNHAVIKGCMFMAAGILAYKFEKTDIREFVGYGRRMPVTSMSFILAAFAMIGMPPSGGFVSKWYLLLAALDAGKYVFAAVIFFSTLLMIAYFWRVIETLYLRVPEVTQIIGLNPSSKEAPADMLVTMAAMGGLSFLVGILWMSGWGDAVLEAINQGFALGGAR